MSRRNTRNSIRPPTISSPPPNRQEEMRDPQNHQLQQLQIGGPERRTKELPKRLALKDGVGRPDFRIWADNIRNYCDNGNLDLVDGLIGSLTGKALNHAFRIRRDDPDATGQQILDRLETTLFGSQTLDDQKTELLQLKWEGSTNPELYIAEMEEAMQKIPGMTKLEKAGALVNGCKDLDCYDDLFRKFTKAQLVNQTPGEIYLKMKTAICCERPTRKLKKVSFTQAEPSIIHREIKEIQELRLQVQNLQQMYNNNNHNNNRDTGRDNKPDYMGNNGYNKEYRGNYGRNQGHRNQGDLTETHKTRTTTIETNNGKKSFVKSARK